MPVPLLHRLREVSDKPWGSFSASDYTPQQWRSACLLDTGQGDQDSKARFKLPVKEPGGALNRNGCHAAASVLGGGRGGVSASPDAKKAAARKLAGLYRSQLKEEPPPSLARAAGQTARQGAAESAADAAPAPGTVELFEAGMAMMQPAGTGSNGRRRFRARIIEGDRWGSSGYYSRQVLERDGPNAWPAGTPMFLDHPGVAEQADRPERSVRDLAGRIASTPHYDGDGLYAEVEIYPHQQPIVDALANDVGLSIRARGTAQEGEAAGRTGQIITSLVRGHSVDFVTAPGAGGRLVEVLESLRATPLDLSEAGSIGAWVESRLHLALTQIGDDMYGCGQLTREERIALSNAVGDGLDQFSQSLMAAAPELYQRTADGDDADMTPVSGAPVSGAPVSGAPVSGMPMGESGCRFLPACETDTIVPGSPPEAFIPRAGSPPPDVDPSTVEDSMTTNTTGPDSGGAAGAATTETTPVTGTTVTEAAPPASAGQAQQPTTLVLPPDVVKRLEESSAFETEARKLLSEAATKIAGLERDRDAALAEARRGRAVEVLRAQAIAALSESSLPTATHQRVVDAVCAAPPLTEAGELDADKAKAAVTGAIEAERAYAAALLEATGVGVPRGLTGQAQPAPPSTEDTTKRLTEALRRFGLDDKQAAVAAKGR
jgi:hypothetical protein